MSPALVESLNLIFAKLPGARPAANSQPKVVRSADGLHGNHGLNESGGNTPRRLEKRECGQECVRPELPARIGAELRESLAIDRSARFRIDGSKSDGPLQCVDIECFVRDHTCAPYTHRIRRVRA